MKHIIEAFSVLVVLVLNLCLCIGMITVSADVAAAKEWKADVIAEIENSDFNPRVIDGCKEQAAQMGYVLEVNTGSYNGARERCVADVRLTYDYKIPAAWYFKEQGNAGDCKIDGGVRKNES